MRTFKFHSQAHDLGADRVRQWVGTDPENIFERRAEWFHRFPEPLEGKTNVGIFVAKYQLGSGHDDLGTED